MNQRLILMSMVMCAFAASPTTQAAQVGNSLAPFVKTYFKDYCLRCHDHETQKGDRRLDQFPATPANITADDDAMWLLEEALDALNLGDMPPKKKNVTQPAQEKTRAVIDWITAYLHQADDAKATASTVMRRLNHFEYLNTLRDLLNVDIQAFDPTQDFPSDAQEEGFDNIGEALVLSDYQLQRYLESAEAFLDKAIFFDQPQPQKQAWHYIGKDFNGVYEYDRAPVTWRLIISDDIIEIAHGQASERHVNHVPAFEKQGGAPADGWYTISVRAAAANRLDHPYGPNEFERYRHQPLKLALWIAPTAQLLSKNAADGRRLVNTWDLPDGAPETFTVKVWLTKGSIPFVSWTNGQPSKGEIRKIAEKFHPEVIRPTNTLRDSALLGNEQDKTLLATLEKNANNKLLSEVFQGPRMRLWAMDIQGPTFEQWPPASHRSLFGDQTDASKINIDQALQQFATRAFRQPVTAPEVEHYGAFVRGRMNIGDSPEQAIKLGLAAILTSPRFLYLDEGSEEASPQLNQHELASRLSYFLWGSMPDAQLNKLAASNKLTTPAALNAQAGRMLRDDKSNAFVNHFLDSWLRLSKLGSMPPDVKTFSTYYGDRLENAMKQETRIFFAYLLHTNGSILDFLDSNYTFINDVLALHYNIKGVTGEHFRKVALKPEHHRGGLLGQGSVLTLTANGIETSPVVRGVWVLENILGTPPSPPPPDVEPLEPDTRGTTTVREQLAKHRSLPACFDCHAKIDPLGFALEFYDPIGGYRSNYPSRSKVKIPVDGAGQLPTGESFVDERGLKALLLDRKDLFTKALTEKMLTYATGRTMTFRDRQTIDTIAEHVAEKGYGLRDLVLAIINSEPFSKR